MFFMMFLQIGATEEELKELMQKAKDEVEEEEKLKKETEAAEVMPSQEGSSAHQSVAAQVQEGSSAHEKGELKSRNRKRSVEGKTADDGTEEAKEDEKAKLLGKDA